MGRALYSELGKETDSHDAPPTSKFFRDDRHRGRGMREQSCGDGVWFDGFSAPSVARAPANRFARLLFLEALQDYWSELWHRLRDEVCLSADPPDLRLWAAKQGKGIVDQWLIGVLRDTVALWKQYPDSPQANLSTEAPKIYSGSQDGSESQLSNVRWYVYHDQPVITHPGLFELKINVYAGTEQDPSYIRKLILDEVKRRWDMYAELQREWRNIGEAWPKHASWTALYLSGRSAAQIEQQYPKLVISHRDPTGTVFKSVRRFAKAIDLTLPKKSTDRL